VLFVGSVGKFLGRLALGQGAAKSTRPHGAVRHGASPLYLEEAVLFLSRVFFEISEESTFRRARAVQTN